MAEDSGDGGGKRCSAFVKWHQTDAFLYVFILTSQRGVKLGNLINYS